MLNNILSRKVDNREMERLRRMLDEAGVEYITGDFHFGPYSWRTATEDFVIDDDGTCVSGFSCVLHNGSYGDSAGLLELWCKEMDEPTGWLSADNVMWYLRRAGIVKG